jgi:hypothetical protein
MKSLIVLIITHKPVLDKYEQISVSRCMTILSKYEIRFVVPQSMDITFYNNLFPKIHFDFVPDICLSTYENFNKLKIDLNFYKRYRSFQYILFYEPDAYIFEDRLSYFINKKIDYVGAPWLQIEENNKMTFTGVGNGGFCLRKVETKFKLILALRASIYLEQFKMFNDFGIIPRIPILLIRLIRNLSIKSEMELKFNYHEDGFWTISLPDYLDKRIYNSYFLKYLTKYFFTPNYKIATISDSLKFSFETLPERLYEFCDFHLPMGCHAWNKKGTDFWLKFIDTDSL